MREFETNLIIGISTALWFLACGCYFCCCHSQKNRSSRRRRTEEVAQSSSSSSSNQQTPNEDQNHDEDGPVEPQLGPWHNPQINQTQPLGPWHNPQMNQTQPQGNSQNQEFDLFELNPTRKSERSRKSSSSSSSSSNDQKFVPSAPVMDLPDASSCPPPSYEEAVHTTK